MTSEAAYRALCGSDQRHARNIAADQPGSREKLFAPKLLAAYEAECRRKSNFIEEAAEAERRLARLVEALRLIMGDKRFRSLLASDGIATIPQSLAQRLQSSEFETESRTDAGQPLPFGSAARQSVSGICQDVLDVVQDCPVKVKIFGLLRHVLPARQLEIARLMVATERVTFTYAKLLVAFTPEAMRAEGFYPAMIANVSDDQLAAMTPELGRLSSEFLSAVERRGSIGLELIAATSYFDRLLNSPKMVRYLARNFGGQLEVFQELLDFRDNCFKNRAPTT